MRFLTRFGVAVAMLAVLAITTAAAASAAAPDPLFLEFTKTGFTVKGGPGTLSTLGNAFGVSCTALTGSGNLVNKGETYTGSLTFTGCNENTLGDAAKTVLFKVKGLLCYIKETGTLEVGLFIEATEAVHLENVPLAGLITLTTGSSDVGTITPINTKAKTFTLKLESVGGGDQKVTSCVDLGVTLKPALKLFIDEGTTETDSALTQQATLTTESEGKIDG